MTVIYVYLVAFCQTGRKLQFISDPFVAEKPMTVHNPMALILQPLKSCVPLLM